MKYFISIDKAKQDGDYSARVEGYINSKGQFVVVKTKVIRAWSVCPKVLKYD